MTHAPCALTAQFTPTTRALLLAAGRGKRMRPLTDTVPKPLLAVHGKPLIEWHLDALARAGIRDVVVNTDWLEDQFPTVLGDGARWDMKLHYSMEGRDHGGALETAGGIAKALPLLAPRGDEPFWVVSADIYAPGFDYRAEWPQGFEASADHAVLWLVPNPPFHPQGDFGLTANGRVTRPDEAAARPWTYANIGLMRASQVHGVVPGTHAPLGPLLLSSARTDRLAGRVWRGAWDNVGTPQQLEAINGR